MTLKDKLLFRKKKEETKLINISVEAEIPVKLEIVNITHQTMALTVSEIAKLYPKNFAMIKHILTEYAFFLEGVLSYRKSGNPEQMFKKLQEFIIRSVKGYLEKYEDSDDIIEEEKAVVKLILHGIASIQEQVKEYEGITDEIKAPVEKEALKPVEDWGKKPKITQRGGLPSADSPITDLKGIGEATAKKLQAIGVKTIGDYADYQRAVAAGEEIEIKEAEETKKDE